MSDTQSLPIAHGHSDCACSEVEEQDAPVLDARVIPHAIRHAAVFGALDSLPSGSALVLVAPHDPLPLLAQARARYAEGLGIDYLQRGPEAWRIRLQRA